MEMGGNSKEALKSYIERIERLTDEKAVIAEDIREVFAEAKGNGFDNKTMRKAIKARKDQRENPAKYEEEEYLYDVYCKALGITPEEVEDEDKDGGYDFEEGK